MKHPVGMDTRMIRHTGIGTYIRELLNGMSALKLPGARNVGLFGQRPAQDLGLSESVYPFRARIYSIEEQLEYPFCLGRCSVWHAPHYNVPLWKGKTRLIVTIHDLIHWIFRKQFFNSLQAFYARKMLARAVQTADHVITVSGQTRSDLVEYFEADPEKISVIYEGVGPQFRDLLPAEVQQIKNRYRLPDRYFLYVGSIKPHKNVLCLIHLFRRLQQEKKVDAPLVLVGKKDKRYAPAYAELARLKTREGIIHLPQVSHEDLIGLYNGALALVHPSLYEGFGLTLLEAMACGTPVIASRTSSIPEVVGDAAHLVDPCSQREMAEIIVRIEKFPNLREEYIRKGKRHVQKFRWEETARQTVEVYERVLETI